MELRNFMSTTIRKYLNEQQLLGGIKLYHRLNNKNGLDLTQFINGVISDGLIRHDNGEIGNVIWFSDDYNDYAKKGKFVVSIDYNEENKEKYQIYYNEHNGYAYKDIPFKDLEIIKIPTLVYGHITSSDDLIRLINKNLITPERLNNLENIIIYGDIFNKYVQPYVKTENFIDKLNSDKIKIINVL